MNCLKMTFRICLTTLFLSTISSALAIQEEYTVANAMKISGDLFVAKKPCVLTIYIAHYS